MLLITGALLLQLGQLKVRVVNLLLENIALIRLLSDVPLSCKNFSLPAVNLLTVRSNLPLEVVVVSILLVEQESGVVYLFAEHVQ